MSIKLLIHASRFIRPSSFSAWIVVVLLTVFAAGCGSSPKLPEPRRSTPEKESVAKPKPAATISQDKTPPAQPIAAKTEPAPTKVATAPARPPVAPVTSAAVTPPSAAPEVPPIPQDITHWDLAAFLQAKQQRNPQLLPAVEALIRRQADNQQEAAEILTALLAPPEPQDTQVTEDAPPGRSRAQRARPRPIAVDTPLCKAVVAGLVQNGSDVAHETIKQILMAQVTSDFPDKLLVTETIAALAAQKSETSDNFLFTVLTMAGQVRRPGSGTVTPEQLQAQALNLADINASPGLRMTVAEHLADPKTSAETRLRLYKLAAAPTAENIPALVHLLKARVADPWKQSGLEPVLAQFSGQAMRILLGISAPEANAATAGPRDPFSRTRARRDRNEAMGRSANLDANASVAVAEHLWQPEFTEELARRVRALHAPIDARNPLLALAMNVPADPVRGSLAEVWQRYWDDGPADFGLDKSKVASVGDPALLAIMKMLPRSAAREAKSLSSLRKVQNKRNNREKKDDADTNAQLEREKKAKEAWLESSFELAKSLNERFSTAARLAESATAATPPGISASITPVSTNSSHALPLPLNRDAEIRQQYHVNWPESIGADADGIKLDNLVVHYVRAECREAPRTVVDHYSGKLSGSEDRSFKGGWWIDSLQQDKEAKLLRSVDVIIRTDIEITPATYGTAQPLVIEILWIECALPESADASS